MAGSKTACISLYTTKILDSGLLLPRMKRKKILELGRQRQSEFTDFYFQSEFLEQIYALISGHPGRLTPGTYGGIAWDLVTFVANLWPRIGALDRFCTSEARYTGKDLRDL